CRRTRARAPTPRGRTPRETHARSRTTSAPARACSDRALALEGTHLDREPRRARVAQPPLERVVQVGRVDDHEPADVLLSFDERTIGEQDVVAGSADD